jgi:hypothetical protein
MWAKRKEGSGRVKCCTWLEMTGTRAPGLSECHGYHMLFLKPILAPTDSRLTVDLQFVDGITVSIWSRITLLFGGLVHML